MTLPLFSYFFADVSSADDSAPHRRAPEDVGIAREVSRADPVVSDPVISDPAELALVRAIAHGDETALRTVYTATYGHLWDFAHSMTRDPLLADEIVQDAYTLLWEKASTWSVQSSVRGFLYLTVRNAARNRIRHDRVAGRSAMRDPGSIAAFSMGVPEVPSDVALEHRELAAAIMAAIATLPETRRTALILRWREQLSYEEIARLLEVTPATARQLITRARRAVRQKIEHLFEP